MTLAELARRPVRTVEPSCTLREAARLMIRYSVGALVITDSTGSNPTGIVTDRDLVVMISEGLDPEQATVDCLVKAPLTTIPVEASLREVTDLMHKHGVRRLPVVDSECELIGLVCRGATQREGRQDRALNARHARTRRWEIPPQRLAHSSRRDDRQRLPDLQKCHVCGQIRGQGSKLMC
jgi:signal-transduction protein with cAMP-binding, CBS, and nucleotidyltransferase domain